MNKPINKDIKFVKIQPIGPLGTVIFRVKSFGEKETIIIVDKKATPILNENVYQDMECYQADQRVKLTQGRKKF